MLFRSRQDDVTQLQPTDKAVRCKVDCVKLYPGMSEVLADRFDAVGVPVHQQNGNLAMLPLRVEYLGNPRHGLGMDASRIALYTLVIPNMARLLLSPVWGRLFDHMNFFALRCTLNIGFAAGIAAFFTSNSTAGLVLGSIVYGVSNAGGDVAWSLWTTKVAPPERVADYMAVHTFLTGVRGVIAPFAAFWAIQRASPAQMGWGAGLMILAATALLLPDIRRRT